MAIVLTNGKFYIATNRKGGIIKTPILEDAQTFYSVNVAIRKMLKSPGKCRGYYPYDTELLMDVVQRKNEKTIQRKNGRLYITSQMDVVNYAVNAYYLKI